MMNNFSFDSRILSIVAIECLALEMMPNYRNIYFAGREWPSDVSYSSRVHLS